MMGPDTRLGWRAEEACADCGAVGCDIGTRQSSLVPGAKDTEGPFISLCSFCYNQRKERREEGKLPLPLGIKPPGVPKEFIKQPIIITTEHGSEYKFGLSDEHGIRTVSCKTRNLGFNKCEILLLEKGKSLWLRGVDVDPQESYWRTSPVSLIH